MATWYVSPTGSASGSGTLANPYDLDTMIGASSPAAAGDTVYLLQGTYTASEAAGLYGADQEGLGAFRVRCLGSSGSSITFRPYPGEHARINGGVEIYNVGGYIDFRNLELAPTPTTRSFASEAVMNIPAIYVGRPGVRFLDCFIHDYQGVYPMDAVGFEMHGCLVMNCGYYTADTGTNRNYNLYGHNHGGGAVLIKKNAFINAFSPSDASSAYNIHLYGDAADVRDYDVEYNILVNGIAFFGSPTLINSGNVFNYNYGYGIRVGVAADINANNANPSAIEAKNNYFRETLGNWPLFIRGFKTLDVQNNTVVSSGVGVDEIAAYQPSDAPVSETWNNNTYYLDDDLAGSYNVYPGPNTYNFANWKINTGFDAASSQTAAMPGTNVTAVIKSEYSKRGFVVIFNYAASASVSIDLSGIGISDGAACRLRNCMNPDEYYDLVYHASSPTHAISMAAADWSQKSPTGYDSPVTWYSEPFPNFGVFLVEELEGSQAQSLFELTLELSKKLQHTVEAVATGGSSTTLVDRKQRAREGHFDYGTIWFKDIGRSAVIEGWQPTTFTHEGDVYAAAGDFYAAASADYPKWLLVQAINQALKLMRLDLVDVSLTTTAYQEQYNLPAGVYNVKKVEVSDEDSDPYGYSPHYHWREQDGVLEFDSDHAPAADDLTLRLTYQTNPEELSEDSDAIDSRIPIEHLLWKAAVHALKWRVRNTREDEADKRAELNAALVDAERAAGSWRPPSTPRDPHFARW